MVNSDPRWPDPEEASRGGADELRDEQLPLLAAEWLARGFDSAELVQLAAMRSTEARTEARRLLPEVVESLGLRYVAAEDGVPYSNRQSRCGRSSGPTTPRPRATARTSSDASLTSCCACGRQQRVSAPRRSAADARSDVLVGGHRAYEVQDKAKRAVNDVFEMLGNGVDDPLCGPDVAREAL